MREILALPARGMQYISHRLRRAIPRVEFLGGAACFCLALLNIARIGSKHVRVLYVRHYEQKGDAESYLSPWGEQHLRLTAELLDFARGKALFDRAMDIGCGEGFVTELLPERCKTVLAVDIVPLVLSRARERCRRWDQVHFAEWDLLRDPPPGVFDLVLAMGVVECFSRPGDLRTARGKIVDCLKPEGYLLVTTVRANEVIESSLWARWLIRGSQNVNAFLAQEGSLKICKTIATETHLFTLYRRDETSSDSWGGAR